MGAVRRDDGVVGRHVVWMRHLQREGEGVSCREVMCRILCLDDIIYVA